MLPKARKLSTSPRRKKPFPSIDAYLARVPEPSRKALERLRRAVRSAAPKGTTETISYGIPAFRYKGLLAWFAAFSDHCSFFPRASVIRKFRRELEGFPTSKGTIRFTPDKPLPLALIRKLVRARVREIDERKLEA
ncbi:MAG TPA: DUF1801 domain-containing protein [Opitutaceae bacterium]